MAQDRISTNGDDRQASIYRPEILAVARWEGLVGDPAVEDWEEPTLEQEFAGRMDAADRAAWAEHAAAVRAETAETTSGAGTPEAPADAGRDAAAAWDTKVGAS